MLAILLISSFQTIWKKKFINLRVLFLDFQKKVLRCFAELKDLITSLGKTYEPEDSDFFIKQVKTIEEFDELEESLADPDTRKMMVGDFFIYIYTLV